jgi:hypothetical protein
MYRILNLPVGDYIKEFSFDPVIYSDKPDYKEFEFEIVGV